MQAVKISGLLVLILALAMGWPVIARGEAVPGPGAGKVMEQADSQVVVIRRTKVETVDTQAQWASSAGGGGAATGQTATTGGSSSTGRSGPGRAKAEKGGKRK